ncbi:MAG TPA: hypothetical protein VKV18_15075 [Chthonomonas sp.]|nr:hypothetical protein [Chthonomonas sp.]HLI49991.1 hypothetical protein [Chthonomonas sp.]
MSKRAQENIRSFLIAFPVGVLCEEMDAMKNVWISLTTSFS